MIDEVDKIVAQVVFSKQRTEVAAMELIKYESAENYEKQVEKLTDPRSGVLLNRFHTENDIRLATYLTSCYYRITHSKTMQTVSRNDAGGGSA